MNISQIEENVKSLVKRIDKESFIFDMLLAYGTPKATITRAKNGSKNLSKNENEIVIKKKVFFAHFDKNIDKEFERLSKDSSTQKHDPRFVIVTDFKTVKALDTKLDDKLEFSIKEFNKKFDFFLPLAGIEKKEFKHENPVDVKAAEKLAKLFDLIKKDNPKRDEKSLHSLNVFLTRLLFCYFSEDTDIFPKSLFTDSIGSHTQNDGSDLSEYLEKLFKVMNEEKRRGDTPDYLLKFPYVNGGLFAENHPVPKFSKKSREVLLEIGDLNWAEINPDIFGSMIQAAIDPEKRAELGMHYTSVTNIMKLIEPLFLNRFYEEFEKSKKSNTKLKKLLQRICNVKIFDPACGSGNFLIIAYKELRLLEMKILKELNEIPLSGVSLSNFYGIELDDFAHEVATLSMWLVDHQMDVMFKEEFGQAKASLPLRDSGKIVCANSLHVKWEEVCPNDGSEIYVLGNPPYLGFKMQSKEQKEDMRKIFEGNDNYKLLDYISCWFIKASKYITDNCKVAFVSTNSLCQGIQVEMLWPLILSQKVEIDFAIRSFKWTNNAKNKAGVICIIVGLRKVSNDPKYIIEGEHYFQAKNVNPYLVDAKNIIVEKRRNPICSLPKISDGSGALDGGFLILNDQEKKELESKDPIAKKFIFPYTGSREYINAIPRWCLWIEESEKNEAEKSGELKKRIKSVYDFRKNAGTRAQTALSRPHRFAWINKPQQSQILIPTVSSERRDYIPIGYLDTNVIISNSASIVHDPELYVFGLICSKMHMAWVKAVAGRLKTDYRYTSAICYNTFPVPELSSKQKALIEEKVYEVLKIREKYSDKSMADLYDPDLMPLDLRSAHDDLDKMVESCYSKNELNSDTDRQKLLFEMYEELNTEDENE